MRNKIVLIGAGGFGLEVFNIIDNRLFEIIGFIDLDSKDISGLPVPIIGNDNLSNREGSFRKGAVILI